MCFKSLEAVKYNFNFLEAVLVFWVLLREITDFKPH